MSDDLLEVFREIQESESANKPHGNSEPTAEGQEFYTIKSALGWVVASVFGGLFIGTLLITWLF